MKNIMLIMVVLCLAAGAQAEFIVNIETAEAMNDVAGWMNVHSTTDVYETGFAYDNANLRTSTTGSDAEENFTVTLQTNVFEADEATTPVPVGTKKLEANYYLEEDGLDGETIVFNFSVLSNELAAAGYETNAFIKVLDAGGGWATTTNETLDLVVGNNYTLTVDGSLVTGSDPRVQIGFRVYGLNDTAGSATADLSVVIGPASASPVATVPDPADEETGVALDAKTLSWKVSYTPTVADANVLEIDPNLVSYNLYFDDDPNLLDDLVETATGITNWPSSTSGDRASHLLTDNYDLDGIYFWRVDMVRDDATVVEGDVWTFEALRSIPVITAQPAAYTLVNPNDPVTLEVTATSVSTAVYQWYKVVDGASDTAVGGDSNQYVIATAQSTDDGSYYCEIRNNATEPTVPAQPAIVSDVAVVGTKREIAHWDFDDGTTNSSIAGFTTTANENAAAVVGVGVGGTYGLVCDGNDMLYTDPNGTYFDICNYNMTVGCWIQVDSNDVPDWSPLVARNGEEDGWQLRHGNTGAIGDKRVRLTMRGVDAASGGADGTASLDTPFDLEWHYVVATYDGASRKVYVDGILQMVNWLTDGAPNSSEGDDVTGTIAPSDSGVSIAGRYGQNPAGLDDQFIAGTYDEVEIWNYARTATQIAQTYATLSGQTVCPTPPPYDLDGDCKEDLVDLALFATGWLDDYTVVDETP